MFIWPKSGRKISNVELNMATEFYVLMSKRRDEKVYADLHKSHERFWLVREEAEAFLKKAIEEDMQEYFHVVKLLAMTEEEWIRIENPV